MNSEASRQAWLKMLDNTGNTRATRPNRNAATSITKKNVHQQYSGRGYDPNETVAIPDSGVAKRLNRIEVGNSGSTLGSSPTEHSHRKKR